MAAVRLLQVTDTHISGGGPDDDPPSIFAQAIHDISGRTPAQALELVLDRSLDEDPPDLVVHTGDVVDDGRPGSYDRAAQLLAQIEVPTLVTPGNHDDTAAMAPVIAEPAEDGLVSFDLGAWRVLLVDSHEENGQHGKIAAPVLARLAEALAASERHVLLGLHHPPLTVCGHPDCSLRNAAELLSLIDAHQQVRGVISGHLHVAEDLQRAGVPYLLSPSTCHQLVHEHPLEDHNDEPTPLGARSIVLHEDGTLDSTVTWVRG